jgi:hypothetical protein
MKKELIEIRNKMMSALEANDLVLAKFVVNRLDSFIDTYKTRMNKKVIKLIKSK